MSFFSFHLRVTTAERNETVRALIEKSRADSDYYFFLILASIITVLGLLLNSASVVIGGMLVAPILTLILALGLGVVTGNHTSLLRSGITILKSSAVVIAVASLVTFFIGGEHSVTEIASRARPSLPYLYIAIASGFAASYAWIKQERFEALPGIAVSVALVPPLAVVGIGFALFNKVLLTGALQLFLLNLIGILFAAILIFSFLQFADARKVEEEEIVEEKREQEKIEKEIEEEKK